MELTAIGAAQTVSSDIDTFNDPGLADAIDQAGHSVVITDPTGNILYVNAAFSRLTGYSREEAIGGNPRVLKSGRQDPDYYRDLWQTIQAGRTWHGELINRRKDGSEYTEEMTIAPVLDSNGQIVRHVAIKKDVTEHRKAEDAQAFLAAIIASSDDAIYSTTSGLITGWNHGAEVTYGYDAKEAVGKPISILMPLEQQERMAQVYDAVKAGHVIAPFDTKRIAKDGRVIDISLKVSPINDAAGSTFGVACIARDISQRLLADQAVRDGAERFRALFEGSVDCIYIHDLNGNFLDANPATLKLLGYDREDLPSLSLASLLDADQLATARLSIRDFLTTGLRKNEVNEFRVKCKDGSFVNVETRITLIPFAGNGRAILGVARDITVRKQEEGALRESEERFRSIADGCPALMWVSDAMGAVSFVNRSYRELIGVTYDRVGASEWQDLLHPDDAPEYVEGCMRAVRERKPFQGEVRLRRPDGEWRWIAAYAEPRWSPTGEFLGHGGVGMDVTENRNAQQAIRDSQDLAQSSIDALSSHVCVLNAVGTILTVNQAWRDFAEANRSDKLDCETFGVGTNYLSVCDLTVGVEAVNAAEFAAGIRAVLQGTREQYSLEYSCHSPDVQRWFIARVTRFSINRAPRALIEHINITERKLAEQILHRSEEKFRQLAENVREVFLMVDFPTGQVLYVSPAYEQIWGQTCESLYANPESWMHSVHPEERAHVQATYMRRVQGEIVESEYRIVQPSGAIRWICDCAFPVRDSGGDIVRIAGVAEDITERKLSELRLAHQALYDELTELPNRRLFQERLGQAIADCEPGTSGAVFFIDLDHFKLINDTLGHFAGDQLLKEIGHRLRAVCGESVTVARFGGNEFSLVATGFEGPASVRHLGSELIRCLERPFRIADREVFMGASIGISLFPENGIDPNLLQRNADLAVHEAKRAGKNQVKFYTPVYADLAAERLEMETSLRKALEQSEFKLQFQPQFASGSLHPKRFEALIRWHPPDAMPIPPFKFIPIAEQNGLIVPIGTWVLQEACRRCADWQTGTLKGVGVAVNVSALQFASPDFLEIVGRTLELTALPAHLLELELTESVLMQDIKASANILTKLRNLGVTIALDDFGTGYSSLCYLQNLPLDALKMDRTFLIQAENRKQGAAVLRCIVELAHTLGLRVVGEGVETIAQLHLLGSLGCDDIQGFLLGKPTFDVIGNAGVADNILAAKPSGLLEQAWELVTN